MAAPVLVASTDGVGTKTKVAAALGRYDTVGQDIVNHCINDILVQGARPLFFLDYIAAGKLDPEMVAAVVGGCAAACRAAGCALLGGETAEMPGVYAPGEFDLAGTIVGVVDRQAVIDGQAHRGRRRGDRPGVHRAAHQRLFAGAPGVRRLGTRAPVPELGRSLGEALLAPHRCYLPEVTRLWAAGRGQGPGAHHRRRADRQPAADSAAGTACGLRGVAGRSRRFSSSSRRTGGIELARDGARLQPGPGHAGRRAIRAG